MKEETVLSLDIASCKIDDYQCGHERVLASNEAVLAAFNANVIRFDLRIDFPCPLHLPLARRSAFLLLLDGQLQRPSRTLIEPALV